MNNQGVACSMLVLKQTDKEQSETNLAQISTQLPDTQNEQYKHSIRTKDTFMHVGVIARESG